MNFRTSALVALFLSMAPLALGCAAAEDYGTPPAPEGDRASADAPTCTLGISSNEVFTKGPLYPTPVCIQVDPPECAADDGTTVVSCNGDRGVCLRTGGGELCLPSCSFADDGAAPVGCTGRDVCNVFGWGRNTSGALDGVGFCFGGCRADGDCPKDSACQVEDGLCFKTKTAYPKSIGTACTKSEAAGALPPCNCLYGSTTSLGYCSVFCVVGKTSCDAGFVCSAQLPTSDATGALFHRDPVGIAGNCVKSCSTNADCSGMNATCKTTASGKVCLPS
jgi:hypothetical protein